MCIPFIVSGINGISWERFGDETLDGWVYGRFRLGLQGPAKLWSPCLVNFVSAVAYFSSSASTCLQHSRNLGTAFTSFRDSHKWGHWHSGTIIEPLRITFRFPCDLRLSNLTFILPHIKCGIFCFAPPWWLIVRKGESSHPCFYRGSKLSYPIISHVRRNRIPTP